ncbi:MAG TPA: cytochrome b N-terminal domain-containing protein [Gemmataceae bacterium]|nr:cytochrome b N-terminal domain-containing protein [Gemmataceae bacterium]
MNIDPRTEKQPGFWESRTGWSRLKEQLLLEPMPGGARWAAAFGSLLLFAFAVQVVTGILLSMSYAPSEQTAYATVKYIQEEVPLGAFIRSLHHWGSSAMVVLLLVHLVQVFVWGAYKRPREFTWMSGVLLLTCTLGLAFTGYLLPWDQKAYWATKVGLGILGTAPGVGDGLRTLLQGGPEIGNLTLTRFFTLHGFVLPGLIIVLVVVHLGLFRRHGVTPAWWQSPAQLKATEEPFWPRQAFKDCVLALLFVAALGMWCYYRQAPLEDQADPAKPYEARPEWYFMFLFQTLKYFEGPYEVVGTFVLPLTFFLILFFWPFLDRNPQRSPRRRPVAMALLLAGTAGLVGLTIHANITDVRMHEPALAVVKEPPPEQHAGPIQLLEVAKVYSDNCAACHGVDGSGKQVRAGMPTIPDFTSLAWQMSQTEFEIAHRIQDGNGPLMPAFRDKLSQAQNLALTIYVRAFAVEPAVNRQAKVAVAPTPDASPQGQSPPHPAAPPVSAPAPSQMAVVLVYRAYCMACHDADGRGSTIRKAMPDIPDFTAGKWQASRSDADLRHSILEGKGKFMLPMKSKLAVSDVAMLSAYVRGFRDAKQVVKEEPKQQVLSPAAERPAVISAPSAPSRAPALLSPSVEETAERTRMAAINYRQFCLTCHGTDGRGAEIRSSMPAIPDFKLRQWQESRGKAELVASILDGKGTLMPAFRGRITGDKAQDLASYIRAFGPPPGSAVRPDASDFETRFHQLQEEWTALQKQLQEIAPRPEKP